MKFHVGEPYSREQIHAHLGGETVSYLPQKDGRIVCGCFGTERNPEAPRVILVGGADEEVGRAVPRKARMLAEQGGTLPVFLKRSSNQWNYQGSYRVVGWTEDPGVIAEKQMAAGRGDVLMVLFLEPAGHTYLLTWNPRRWAWHNLETVARLTAEGQPVIDRWSCGRRRRISVGDRLFLLRQRVKPRGIIASGIALSEPYEHPHWDPSRREQGESALEVDVRFDRILDPDADDPLPLSKLETGRLATVNWSTQVSGIDIGEAADELEEVWRQHLRLYAEDEAGQSALEGEVRVALRRHRARERWLREAKIAEWKAAHDGRLPCHVCGFEFREAYGEIGRDYAQVHHLKPLGDRLRPSETRLGDLAVLCANCHVMVHRGGESRPIDRLGG